MIRIFIADDHVLVRAGIRALLDLQDDFEVVGEASTGQEAIAGVARLSPDVVLMDIRMPGMDGLAATRELVQSGKGSRVIVLTQHENREYLLPALRVGACGYVLKRAPDDTLVQAIRSVHAGGTYLDPRVAETLVQDIRRGRRDEGVEPFDTLSERERQILVLLAQGQTYQAVAQALFISVKTVDFHRANVMRKLGLKNRTELTVYATEHGLLS